MAVSNNTIELPITKSTEVNDLVDFLEFHKIYRRPGAIIRLKPEEKYPGVIITALFALLGMALISMEKKGKLKSLYEKSGVLSAADSFSLLSNKKHPEKEIVKFIQKRYKISVLIGEVGQEKNKPFSLDDVFGLWKKQKKNLSALREKQWAKEI